MGKHICRKMSQWLAVVANTFNPTYLGNGEKD
jgi:hypothetical protein